MESTRSSVYRNRSSQRRRDDYDRNSYTSRSKYRDDRHRPGSPYRYQTRSPLRDVIKTRWDPIERRGAVSFVEHAERVADDGKRTRKRSPTYGRSDRSKGYKPRINVGRSPERFQSNYAENSKEESRTKHICPSTRERREQTGDKSSSVTTR